jgi:Fe-Mn family superoxide dismutase
MTAPSGPFKLAPLPWSESALEPILSARVLALHHGKHHAAYVNKLNELVVGTRFADMPLERVIAESAGRDDQRKVFNNAAQAWNHAFFWQSLRPAGGAAPSGELARRIESDFGGIDKLRRKLSQSAVDTFGSGWAWLVDRGGKLEVMSTSNAGTPLTTGATALLALDVWEHAYYLDYENRRPEYVDAVIDKLLDWDFAASQFAGSPERRAA